MQKRREIFLFSAGKSHRQHKVRLDQLMTSWFSDRFHLLPGAHQMDAPSDRLLLLPRSSKIQDNEPFFSLSLFSFSLEQSPFKTPSELGTSQILQQFFAVPRLKKTKDHSSFPSICWAIFSESNDVCRLAYIVCAFKSSTFANKNDSMPNFAL